MDSLKSQSRIDYSPDNLPEVECSEVQPQMLHSSAPYMPLHDQELGGQIQNNAAYPELEPPRMMMNQYGQDCINANMPEKSESIHNTPETNKSKIQKI